MKKPSQCFQSSARTRWLVPLLLGVILLGLAASLIIVILSMLGVTPA